MARAVTGKDVMIMVVLFALGLLAAFLWLKDPNHQGTEKSRIEWPEAAPSPR